jgi:starch-binding outer membrane protein SusE/F
MKNFIKYVSLACASIFALSACNDDEDIIKLDPSTFVASKVETPAKNTYVLNEEDAANNAFTVKWSTAVYGVTTIPKYTLEIDKKGNNFKTPAVITSTSATSYDVSVKDLNNFANELGIDPYTEGELEYRVVSSLGTNHAEELISNVNTIKVTPYATDLSTNWGVVGSITGWAEGKDIPFWKSGTANIYVAYIDVDAANSEIKFRQDGAWTVNYGDDGADNKLDAGGANIKIADVGSYKVTFDAKNLTYKLEKFTWGLVGDATTNGWNGPDMKLTYDGTIDSWTTIATLKDGEYKIRKNNDWDAGNYGGANGTLVEKGDNIKIKAGKYKITVNFAKSTYSVEAQ